MKTISNKKVLISGASFAGLSTAYWMNKMGYEVTVVELAAQLKRGGTPVNILEGTIDAVQRMGLLEGIIANSLHMQRMDFRNTDDVALRSEEVQQREVKEYEIERDVLLHMLFDAVQDEVTFLFGDSIVSLTETADGMTVGFRSGQEAAFDLIFGCDGIHSAVRKLWFGEESAFSHFLKTYFSITIVDQLLIPEHTTQMYNEPGRMVMLNAYNNKTDIVLCFHSEQELAYDYRNEEQQRAIIYDQFTNTGWRTPELLELVKQSKTFYFDKLCQMKMPSWTKGRVALVGDAGYCASPAAGRGGSLAIDGAAALAAAFEKYPDHYEKAFVEYNNSFRPFIEKVQADVVDFGLDMLLPLTEEAINARNTGGFPF